MADLLWARLVFLMMLAVLTGLYAWAAYLDARPAVTHAMPLPVNAAGATDPGRQREVNEDRFHVDAERGLYIVVDGVGGQAAGGKAADLALAMLRARLERETGPVTERIREAIAIANDEIYRVAATRLEWDGMACVLTVAVVDGARVVVGHVGDTRVYKLRDGRLEKITRDHSPIGEREDAGELTEAEAMKHPRRNEVYRDVGSEAHTADEPGFIDTYEIAFEPDAALLLCSDGLSDLIDSAAMALTMQHHAGRPGAAVQALIAAANDSGGRDNITAVVVEGAGFAAAVAGTEAPTTAIVRPTRRMLDVALGMVLTVLALGAVLALDHMYPLRPILALDGPAAPIAAPAIVVHPGESIVAALGRAEVGGEVTVEPGDYEETLALVSGVRLVSRVPRGATIRLPRDAADLAMVSADGVTGAELVGFRIAGESASPQGTGVRVARSELSIIDVEITGATGSGIDIDDESHVNVVGCDLHDNRGVALTLRPGTSSRVAHTTFARNGAANRGLLIQEPAGAEFVGNVFEGVNIDVFAAFGEAARTAISRGNWFVGTPAPAAPAPGAARGRRGRG